MQLTSRRTGSLVLDDMTVEIRKAYHASEIRQWNTVDERRWGHLLRGGDVESTAIDVEQAGKRPRVKDSDVQQCPDQKKKKTIVPTQPPPGIRCPKAQEVKRGSMDGTPDEGNTGRTFTRSAKWEKVILDWVRSVKDAKE